MPKLILCSFSDSFLELRRRCIASAKERIAAESAHFRQAGRELDAEYSLDLARERIKSYCDQSSAYLILKPFGTYPRGVGAAGHVGDDLRGWRLLYAVLDFLSANREGDLLRLLGESPGSGSTLGNARRAVLLALSVLDSKASEYLGDYTTLACGAWHAQGEAARGIRTRASICSWFNESSGHRVLSLLEEALARLAEEQPSPAGREVASFAEIEPPNDLRACLYTLAANLDAHEGGTYRLLCDEIQFRHRMGLTNQSLLNSGQADKLKRFDALLKSSKDRFEALNELLYPCRSPEFLERARPCVNLSVRVILQAMKFVKEGSAQGLKEASGGTITSSVLLADLYELHRKLVQFMEDWIRPRPFESSLLGFIVALRARLLKAADLLRAFESVSEPGGVTAGMHPKAGKANAPTVVLWEGAAHTEENVRLARTRTAYLEAHGNAKVAIQSLAKQGISLATSTFYNHLNRLDVVVPRWRDHLLQSSPDGIPEGTRQRGRPRNSR